MKKTLPILLLTVFLSACANSKMKKNDSENESQKFSEVFDKEYQSSTNSTNQFILGWSESKKDNVVVTKYAIYDKEKKEVIYNSSLLNGYVKWLSETELVVKDMPGIISADSPVTTYRIDIIKKTKVPYNPNYEK